MARARIMQAGLDWTIDSAGTGAWHIGEPPDTRMVAAAADRGIDLTRLRARQVESEDFHRFDHVFAMDRNNLMDLKSLRPAGAPASLDLFLGDACVPDPYYGGPRGFEEVLDLISKRLDTIFATLT